ncbi:MAG TPA: ester cyclase [Gemmataceae bacterium]|nr:ester cyclase [Gemmataceae bacterium]
MNTTELEPHQMPKAIVNWLFAECLNEGDLSVADQLVSPDFTGPAGKGPEGFKAMVSPLRQGFPDLRFTIQDMVAEGSRVVVRWTSQGTHRGMFAGTAPTGRQVSNESIGMYRVEDG